MPDETVIQFGSVHYWPYATVDPKVSEFLKICPSKTTELGYLLVFLVEFHEKHDIDDETVLVDDADSIPAELLRLCFRFYTRSHEHCIRSTFGSLFNYSI